MPMARTAVCRRCGGDDWYEYKRGQRTTRQCLECKRRNRDRIAATSRRWKERNPLRSILHQAKRRATKKGIPFDLTVDDLHIPAECPVLGIKMERGRTDTPLFSSPSLDRFDPNKGYTRDNVRVISYRANMLKNNASVAEMEKVLQYMKQEVLEGDK